MTTSTINVNHTQCDAPRRPGYTCPHTHCAAKPVLIPCPIPRSVIFQVVLGECTCADDPEPGDTPPHLNGCPARPVKVSCSISGSTWEESEPTEYECRQDLSVTWGDISGRVVAACRSRWSLVKRVVLGVSEGEAYMKWPTGLRLYAQRDAVYSALADMALAEEVLSERANAILKTCARKERLPSRDNDDASPSVNLLCVYVAHIIEQVGIIGVGA